MFTAAGLPHRTTSWASRATISTTWILTAQDLYSRSTRPM